MLKKVIWEDRHKESIGKYNRVTDFARLCYFNFMKLKKSHTECYFQVNDRQPGSTPLTTEAGTSIQEQLRTQP